MAGDVVVTPDDGEPVTMGKGDRVTFPAGMSYTWQVKEALQIWFVKLDLDFYFNSISKSILEDKSSKTISVVILSILIFNWRSQCFNSSIAVLAAVELIR